MIRCVNTAWPQRAFRRLPISWTTFVGRSSALLARELGRATSISAHPPLVLAASMVTGAAPPVRVATLHRCGAENGSDKKTLQARVRREERNQLSQFSQPLHPSAQRRQVTATSARLWRSANDFRLLWLGRCMRLGILTRTPLLYV